MGLKYAPRGTRPSLRSAVNGLQLRPVFGIDIDGTLGNYWQHFIWFAELWTGRKMPPWDIAIPGTSLAAHCGLSKVTYRRIKLAYRQGGLKRFMPVFPDAGEMVAALRRRGAEVWLCTSRPYLQVTNVEEDTRHWLRRHHITYDGFLSGENKYRQLVRTVGHRQVVALADDLPEMWRQAEDLDVPCIRIPQPYNGLYGLYCNLENTREALLGELDKWEQQLR